MFFSNHFIKFDMISQGMSDPGLYKIMFFRYPIFFIWNFPCKWVNFYCTNLQQKWQKCVSLTETGTEICFLWWNLIFLRNFFSDWKVLWTLSFLPSSWDYRENCQLNKLLDFVRFIGNKKNLPDFFKCVLWISVFSLNISPVIDLTIFSTWIITKIQMNWTLRKH